MRETNSAMNDPRLTAYALGELSGVEAEALREVVNVDPEAQAFVDETRELASLLAFELEKEAQPRLSLVQREKLLPKAKGFSLFRPHWALQLSLALVVVGFVAYNQRHKLTKLNAAKVQVAEEFVMKEAPQPAAMDVSSADRIAEPSAPAASVFAGGGKMAKRAAPSSGGAMGLMGSNGAMQAAEGFGGMAAQSVAPYPGPMPYDHGGSESYSQIEENGWLRAQESPLSTFSIDVDTASYSNVRRFLNQGQLPPADAVRIEELVNYFPYDYAPPTDDKPFAVHVEMAETPWTEDHQLVRIALRGKDVAAKERPKLNLVFLVDVSGSMDDPTKLPLLQQSLKLLSEQLNENDRVAIVVYAGASGLVLPPTSDKGRIRAALDELKAGGSTNGASGIQLAYDTLQQNFVKGGVNRVILATDGDFNVGVTSEGDLVKLIQEKAKGGAFLSVLGFGMGNLKDSTMVKLADKGNGNYAYIDTIAEAQKALVEQLTGTLVTIAKDVKIQVEFNPAYVGSYRLIGYEKRMLQAQDFNDDKKDAGEIGAGHTVTAIYEIIPAGKDKSLPKVDALKYWAGDKKQEEPKNAGVKNGEVLNVKVRYKEPTGDVSKKFEVPLKNETKEFGKTSGDFQFAAAVAAFGMLLRESEHKGVSSFEVVASTAAKHTSVKGKESSYRTEFVELARKAAGLKRNQLQPHPVQPLPNGEMPYGK